MKFNKSKAYILGVFGCPPCVDDEEYPNYLCDGCDTTILDGGIKGWIAKKCDYTFSDITDSAEWETAIANKDVFGRINGNRILGEMPAPDFSTKRYGSCGQEEVTKQSRTVSLQDAENDSDLSLDIIYNYLAKKFPNYEFAFVSCDNRLIGFFDDVAVRTFHVAPQTNEENAYFTAEFRYDEQVGEFAQFQLDFLNTLTLNVCWVSSIVVSGEGAAVTVPNGSDLQMIATVLPTSATDATVVWSVVNGTGTATIDANGLLSGTGIGTVTVIATANDAGAVSGSIEIEVV
jgi:hypothetical protein